VSERDIPYEIPEPEYVEVDTMRVSRMRSNLNIVRPHSRESTFPRSWVDEVAGGPNRPLRCHPG
jgi:hypothetical protein